MFLCVFACACDHVLARIPAAVGGESNSDKQLCCYKGGRKSIKRDNKIAIEFFIADAWILDATSHPTFEIHRQDLCNLRISCPLKLHWFIHK